MRADNYSATLLVRVNLHSTGFVSALQLSKCVGLILYPTILTYTHIHKFLTHPSF